MNTPLDDSLIALKRIIRATESGARKIAREADMATSELLTLQTLADHPRMSPGELAKALSLSPVTSTVILQKLESRGLIQKVRSKTDRRRLEVELTDEGRSELQSTPSAIDTSFSREFQNLPLWEQHLVAGVLGRVTEMINTEKHLN